MNIDDPAMLVMFDGKIAYIGRCPDGLYYARRSTDARFSEHETLADVLVFSEHETLADALVAAAEICGAAP